MKTTIQLSNELRRRLKILASYRDLSYQEILEDLLDAFNAFIPFKNESEFAEWFEKNFKLLGFKKILKKRAKSYPDYLMEDIKGNKLEVELELVGRDFLRHKHDPRKVDLILCVFSTESEIAGVPVLSLIQAPKSLEEIIRRPSIAGPSISIPTPLYEKIKEIIENTGFTSVRDFVLFVLRTILLETGKEGIFTKEEIEKVKKKLKALGYW